MPAPSKSARVIERVGFIGIGNIGEAMATNILAAGFDLMVYDLRPEPSERMRSLGAKVASSPDELGAHGELIEVSIAGDEQIEAALTQPDGLLAGMHRGSIIALHSTMHPRTVLRIAERGREHGVHVIDSPVSGGKKGAEERRLCYMVGGDRTLLDRCRPVFETSGSKVFAMGPLGAGASAKLAQQMITCMNIVAVAEGFRVATAAGVDASTFRRLLDVSTAQSYVASHWAEFTALGAEGREGLHLGLQPALSLAHDVVVPAPSTALAQQLIADALTGLS